MTYADWKSDFVPLTAGSPELAARLWNLENEMRIKAVLTEFRRKLGLRHKTAKGSGKSGTAAAQSALQQVVAETDEVNSHWLGKLEVSSNRGLPSQMCSQIPVGDFARYVPSGHIDLTNPPQAATFGKSYKMTNGNPYRRFIWMTFEPDGKKPSNNPTIVVRQLGLAHYPQGEFIYRFWLDVGSCQLYTPTCLDAGLYEAWAPPPGSHSEAWGLTRDLQTGKPRKPELLTQTIDHAANRPQVQLVSPSNRRQKIGPIIKDFMAAR